MRKIGFTIFLCLFSLSCFAASFNSKDGSFSISLPPKWQRTATSNNEVLNLKKGTSKINISKLSKCNDLQCLESTANAKIKQIKNKKLKLVKNTYSGEEIKRSEFSTLDPYIYFSYSNGSTNYTEGYFLADSNGYKIEIINLSPTDADLYLSFIAPKPKEIKNLPLITEEEPLVEENIAAPVVEKPEWKPLSQTLLENEVHQENNTIFIVSPKFSTVVLAVFIYLAVAMGFFVCNFVFSSSLHEYPANPISVYPIIGTRLYGAPDLFFRLYDNQGKNFIVTSQRWCSFLKEYGFYGIVLFTLLHFILSSVNTQNLSSSLWLNTALSLCYLFVLFGLIFILAGYILDILFPTPIFIYTDKGKILFKIVRRHKGLLGYSYLVLTDSYNIEYRLETKKIFLLRKWTLFDKEGQIAFIREKSFIKALARKLLGHLGGSLRTSYWVKGKNESKGQINSIRKVTTDFQIDMDKPQAFPSEAILAAAAVIFTKNRDKFYPWFD